MGSHTRCHACVSNVAVPINARPLSRSTTAHRTALDPSRFRFHTERIGSSIELITFPTAASPRPFMLTNRSP
jgi:hypothetical protein